MSFLDTLLGRKHAPMIGLDISSSSVKLVELGQTASGEYVVERFGVESFEKGWIADGQIEKFDEVADVIEDVVEAYLALRARPDELFVDTVKRLGVEPFRERVYATR